MNSFRLIGLLLVVVLKTSFLGVFSQTEFKSLESALKAHDAGENVEVLILKKQKLHTVPLEIRAFTGLKELRLNKNLIDTLPFWLSELTHLEILALERNQLQEFPSVLLKCINLREIYLGDNFIKAIPIDIDTLKNLEWLGLWSNLLRVFPASLSDMPNLKTLDILYNDMTFSDQTWLRELLPHLNIEMSESCNCKFDDSNE